MCFYAIGTHPRFYLTSCSIKQLEAEVVKAAELLKQYKESSEVNALKAQRLKDDMLVQEIHMNLAEKKAAKLQEENEALVNRWMQKAADEAERMNDANAFLQRYVYQSNFVHKTHPKSLLTL
jgi:hypothetical protein